MKKFISISVLPFVALAVLCTSCTKHEDRVIVLTETVSPSVGDMGENSKLISVVRRQQQAQANDTLSTDSANVECYQWEGEYQACTKVENDVDHSFYEVNILINLLNSSNQIYEGGMVLYIDEENFVEAVIRGVSEGNHITLYYVDTEENTTGDLFHDGDKLVQFELFEGEYAANWYKAMHRFVNETTVISIQ